MALVSSKQVSSALNVSVRRVEQLVHEGMPRADRGKYDLGQCLLWYVRYLQKAIERRGAVRDGSEEVQSAKARLVAADADLREIELAEKRGSVVSVDDTAPLWEDAVTRMRSRLISSGRKNAPQLVGLKTNAQAEDAIMRVVYEALEELVQLSEEMEDAAEREERKLARERKAEADDEISGGNGAAAKPKPRRAPAKKAAPEKKPKGAARGRG